ncbi:MAG: flagellar basal body rod protein FlgF [Gammaproteobacteria bacterium]|nr:flagellar basal body rod protein FlgF [Gammaproteobacteria bacterium]
MDRMLFVAMTAARQTELALASHTNNLANVSTTGFRADFQAYRSMPVFGEGHDSRVYAMTERPATDFATGVVQSTGRDLDIAVNGEGWIAVQAADGSEAYTRAGDLRVNNLGLLETGTGLPVLGNAGPIAIPPAEKIEIGVDGTISVQPLGESVTTLAVVDRIRLVNPPKEQLFKGEDGLIRAEQGVEVVPDGQLTVNTGSLESSNVNAVDALVNMISTSRQFEMQVKMMSTAQNIDEASSKLLRLG